MKYVSALFAVALVSVTACADKSGKDPQTAANANDATATSTATITKDGTAAYPTNDSTVRQDAPQPVTIAPSTRTTTTELSPPVPSTAGRTDAAPLGQSDPMATTGPQPPVPAPTPSTQDPTNTARNERDARGGTLTPFDQGGSEADRRVTQKVRQSLIADSGLSFTAKNVKIITIDGKVTLRGPVKSDQERSSIEQKAKTTAGVKAVDNQLEIKR